MNASLSGAGQILYVTYEACQNVKNVCLRRSLSTHFRGLAAFGCSSSCPPLCAESSEYVGMQSRQLFLCLILESAQLKLISECLQ